VDLLGQDTDDYCAICYCEPLGQAPSLRLECGHIFHASCLTRQLEAKWNGPAISFSFRGCPQCKRKIEHPALEELLAPLGALEVAVRSKALQRLAAENLTDSPDITTPGKRFYQDPEGFALERFNYYQCYSCSQPYFGGLHACGGAPESFDPSELICGACAGGGKECNKHDTEYLEFKCRFCCSVAIWFCFGTTHFCEGCHNDYRLTSGDAHESRKDELPSCPAGPALTQLPPGPCPLGMQHAPTGEEFCLGCGLCRNKQTF